MKEVKEYKQEQDALYQEEWGLSEKEPKYFPEEHGNIDKEEIIDFTELLPEEYGYSGSREIINHPEISSEEENN